MFVRGVLESKGCEKSSCGSNLYDFFLPLKFYFFFEVYACVTTLAMRDLRNDAFYMQDRRDGARYAARR